MAGWRVVGRFIVKGFIKGNDKLAMKIDPFGVKLFLAVFNEKGKDPLLHGVVFGKNKIGRTVSGDKAKEILLKELREIEKNNGTRLDQACLNQCTRGGRCCFFAFVDEFEAGRPITQKGPSSKLARRGPVEA